VQVTPSTQSTAPAFLWLSNLRIGIAALVHSPDAS
jgi:hypothetical protein